MSDGPALTIPRYLTGRLRLDDILWSAPSTMPSGAFAGSCRASWAACPSSSGSMSPRLIAGSPHTSPNSPPERHQQQLHFIGFARSQWRDGAVDDADVSVGCDRLEHDLIETIQCLLVH